MTEAEAVQGEAVADGGEDGEAEQRGAAHHVVQTVPEADTEGGEREGEAGHEVAEVEDAEAAEDPPGGGQLPAGGGQAPHRHQVLARAPHILHHTG